MTSANFRRFAWTDRAERAALLVAEDLRTDVEIAAEAKITDRQLRNWKAHPEFAQRVQEHVGHARRGKGGGHRQPPEPRRRAERSLAAPAAGDRGPRRRA